MLTATIFAACRQSSKYALFFCAATLTGSALARADQVDWFVDAINTPQLSASVDDKSVILVAIVDDGFRLSHQDLRDFVWTNPGEKPNNRIDDDGNGFVDDVHGWDVSDADNDVGVPDDRPDLYHGTHIASIVVQIARTAYGDAAPARIRILPIKAIADRESSTYIKAGYDGVRYAIQAGADIIVCPWGVAHITPAEANILQEALDKGIVVVASAGNVPQELEQFPAAFDSVLAVGSVEKDSSKTYKSNYGQFVDITAPGSDIRGASIEGDDAYAVRSGTSFSTAMVAAAAALIRQGRPGLSISEVEACLLSSSKPVELPSREFSAKLGAGILDIQAAVACELLTEDGTTEHYLTRSKGYLHAFTKTGRSVSWIVRPPGEFSGIRFKATGDQKQELKGTVEFRAGSTSSSDLVASYALDELPDSVFVPGTVARVSLDPRKRRRAPDWLIRYEAEAINFSELFCRGTQKIDGEGTLSDGSGPDPYSAASNCKWLITAPPGKVIRFEFDEMDTEPRTDMIHFFNGSGTHEQLMAVFSGTEIPPVFTTWNNQVLVWFVTNGNTQGQGWRATFTFEDQ